MRERESVCVCLCVCRMVRGEGGYLKEEEEDEIMVGCKVSE